MRSLSKLSLLVALAACGSKPPTAVSAPPPEPPPPHDVTSQVEPPPAEDPAPVVDGDVTDAWVSGIHVIVKRVPGAETVATTLVIQGGVANWGEADAGIEQLALSTATTGGTEQLSKDDYNHKLSDLGSRIMGGADRDLSTIDSWSLLPAWDETFALQVDTFLHPALPPQQLELIRQQQIAGLKQEQDDPDGKLTLMVEGGIYSGLPYANRATGTVDSVAALKREQLVAHLAKLRVTSRLMVVVVGDVPAEKVIEATRTQLGQLPRGSFQAVAQPRWTNPKGVVTIVDQKLPTTYIQAVFPGPSWAEADYPVAVVAMSYLGYRLFEEVRTKRNLSYAPGAWFQSGTGLTMGAMYVTATDPKTTMQVILDEAKKLRDTAMSASDLEATKSTTLTRIATGRQAVADQAATLARSQAVGGDWRLSRDINNRVKAVTAAQVQAWAAKNITHLRTFVLGDKSNIDVAALVSF